ncbi:MAG: toxin-antitoxin system HicB family antitoxin [Acidovorax sp.]
MDDEDRYTRITLRIPKDLHRSLSNAAYRTSKSLNAEIVGRLEQSLRSSEQDQTSKFEKALLQQRLDSQRALYATERMRVNQLRDRVDRLVRENAKFEAIEAASREYEEEAYHLDALGKQVKELEQQLR